MSKVRTSDYFDDSLSNRRGFLRMQKIGTPPDIYWTGEFTDPRGIVSIYRDSRFTRLDFSTHGRLFIRSWERPFADATLHRLARDFVTDILNGVLA